MPRHLQNLGCWQSIIFTFAVGLERDKDSALVGTAEAVELEKASARGFITGRTAVASVPSFDTEVAPEPGKEPERERKAVAPSIGLLVVEEEEPEMVVVTEAEACPSCAFLTICCFRSRWRTCR